MGSRTAPLCLGEATTGADPWRQERKARDRLVHAKVYRFFQPQPKREVLFVGSANLTNAAHRSGGNLETGFLVELDPPRRPDRWLASDVSKPKTFRPESEDEGAATSGGTKLSIRFFWNTESADAFWDGGALSPSLSVKAHGVEIFKVEDLHVFQELVRVRSHRTGRWSVVRARLCELCAKLLHSCLDRFPRAAATENPGGVLTDGDLVGAAEIVNGSQMVCKRSGLAQVRNPLSRLVNGIAARRSCCFAHSWPFKQTLIGYGTYVAILIKAGPHCASCSKSSNG